MNTSGHEKSVRIASTAVVYPHVVLGEGSVVEDFCVIGAPLRDGSTPETVIGARAYLRSHTVIYSGNKIGRDFQTGNKANIREFNEIGDDVSIGTLSVIEHRVTLEDGVRIHSQCFVPEFSHLKKNSWLGPQSVLTNAKVPLSPEAKKNLKGPTLEAGAIVGANCTLAPGVSLGERSLLGAGSVLTKNLDPEDLAFGNPARVVKKRSVF